MISRFTKIHFMDVDHGAVCETAIHEIFQMYSHLMTRYDATSYIINFKENNIHCKVTSEYGWTDLNCIIKREADWSKWYKLSSADKFVHIYYDTIYPSFRINEPTIGFHGDVRYKVDDVKAHIGEHIDEHIRLHRGHDNEGNKIEFTYPIITKLDIDKVSLRMYGEGYDLSTKQGLFNANHIVLSGKNYT